MVGLLFRKSPRSASPHNQLVPFAHFLAASGAIVKRFAHFTVEIRGFAAFVAAALNTHPSSPDRQISALAEASPKSSGVSIAPR